MGALHEGRWPSPSYQTQGKLRGMLRMRRCHRIRSLWQLLILGIVLYFLLHHEISSSLSQPATKYVPRPTYEHMSIYRQNANSTFEATLDAQLLALERSIQSSLPSNEQNPIANFTIHQFTTEKRASQMSTWVNQWRTNNPGWAYNLITTHPTSLLSVYSSIPSILSAYEVYPSLIPDLTRYMLLWYYGGFYTDIATWERVSLIECDQIVMVNEGGKEVSLMVGVDRDEPYYNLKTIEDMGWSRGFGFGMDTMWAVRRFDPILRTAIVRSISHADAKKKLDSSWRDAFQSDGEEAWRSEISGAGMFTDIVLEALSRVLSDDHELRDRDAGLERRVTWKKFKGLKKTLWIDPKEVEKSPDILGMAVLPINVWSNGQGHSGSGTTDEDEACVNRLPKSKPHKKWYQKAFW